MTQQFHSTLNTYLLGILSVFMAASVALAGFVLHAVYDINGTVKAHDISISTAADKARAADERTSRIEEKVDSLQDGNEKILIALEGLKSKQFRP